MTNRKRKASDRHKSGMDPAGEQPENETLPTERVELANPKPDPNVKNHEDAQSLLPHERDQTTRRQGSSLSNENERSRAVMGQAAKNTQRGLKDTDRRGIPSDIIASDADGGDA